MTRTSLTTDNYNSPQKNQPVRWTKPDHVVLHHWAGTNWNNVVGMMVNRTRVVSSNVIIQDSRLGSMMEEEDRSWSLASAHWDGRSLTAECGNSSVGGSWPLSPDTHEMIAKWVADVCTRYEIPINRDRVLGHREVFIRHGASYATACPGGMDLEWIVNRARAIQETTPENPEPVVNPAPMVPATPTVSPENATFNGYRIVDIQRRLGIHGFKTATDGIYGPHTRSQVRAFQSARRLTVDGIVGPQTWSALVKEPSRPQIRPYDSTYNGYSVRRIQQLLTARGMPVQVDGIYGPATTQKVREFQKRERIGADGIVGPITWGRLNAPAITPVPVQRPTIRVGSTGEHVRHAQRRLGGLAIDGVFGGLTERRVRDFQSRNRLVVDGIIGPSTWAKLG
jgi:peptidoglycan hydrolase-like protein with peptidoglycan-binding domain